VDPQRIGEQADGSEPSPRPSPVADGDAPTASAPPYGARLTVSAVAHRLGVAPATLRTWARRYGLGPSEHSAGEHRRYSAADLARPVGTGTMAEAVGNLRTPATSLRQGLNEGQPVREDETVGTRTER